MEKISCKQAKQLGYKQYFTGKPCPKGHISPRWCSSHQCSQCDSDNAVQKFQTRKKSNPEKVSQESKRYRASHSDFCLHLSSKRRLQHKNASPTWANQEQITEIYKLSSHLTKTTGIPHHVDHIVPLISGVVCGLHVEYNLQVLTKTENLTKKNKFEISG